MSRKIAGMMPWGLCLNTWLEKRRDSPKADTMTRYTSLLPLYLAVGLGLLVSACETTPPHSLAIRDVTVIDVVDGSLQSGVTVLVDGNQIVAVQPADEVSIADDAEVIDGTGGYLIPGLWDAHVHSAAAAEWHFPIFLALGITGVRNMHSTADAPLERTNEVKRRLLSGELRGPRFLANGGLVDGDPPAWPGSVVVRNAEEARAAVDMLAVGGADFIKVYDNLTRDAYLAAMDQAQQRGIPVDGHLPFQVPPEEAAAAGQRTIEHTSGITMGCSAEADALRAEHLALLERMPTMRPFPDRVIAFFTLVRRAMDSRDPAACAETVRAYQAHGVAVVPTLLLDLDAETVLGNPERMRLLPPSVRAQWTGMAQAGDDPFVALLGPTYPTLLENVRLLHDANVPILAGTDLGNPFLVPGFSLHDEMELLVTDAGFSPLDALRAATINPARVFALADSLGTVEAGKRADLVLLEANPLDDITNTLRIRAVVADGHIFRRADLDRLLADVEAQHQ